MMAGSTLLVTFVLLFLGPNFQVARGQDAEERIGVCPPIIPLSLESCTDLCTFDKDCPAGRKCCKTGCKGMSCKVPNEKAGVCPAVGEVNQEPCPEGRACFSDSNCEEFLKCCPHSCGRKFCKSPEGTNEKVTFQMQSKRA